MKWSNTDLGAIIGVTRQTFYSYVQDLEKKRKFKKTREGRFYYKADVKKLATLIGFELQDAIDYIKNKK